MTSQENKTTSATQTVDDQNIERNTPAEPSRLLRRIKQILPPLFLLVVAVLADQEFQNLNVHAIRGALGTFTAVQFFSVQLLAVAGVFAMGLYDLYAARVFSITVARQTLLQNAWIANTFNNLVGLSGLAGSGIRILLLRREQVDIQRAGAMSALIMASIPVGLAALCWPLILSGGEGTDRLPVPAWAAWSVVAGFAIYLPVYLFVFYKGSFIRVLHGLSGQKPGTLLVMIVISTLDWLLAYATCWLAVKFAGASVPPLHFLYAFVLASAVGILSLIPGGLGVFDLALAALLARFVEVPESIVSGLLVYRLCYYFLPWLTAVYVGAERLVIPDFLQSLALVRQLRDSRLPQLLRLPLDVLASLGVRVLAYLTFGGGVVLLVSSTFPVLKDRFALLYQAVPLAAIELSHLLSVASGVMLIALSRGIAAQVRSAYHLTQLLLIGGAAFSLLKGIDFEEAIVLLTVSFLLRQQRQRFYRQSFPLLSTHSLKWMAGLLVSVVGFAWLGDWVHGDVSWGWDSLSRFAPASHAPRFVRGMYVASAVVVAFIGWSLFRRPKPIHGAPDEKELAAAEAVMTEYGGNDFAHLLFLGDKSLQWSTDRKAFIQYGAIRDRLIALGDPLGATDSFDKAIIAFRDFADLHDLTPCFYEVSEQHIHRYHDAGFALFKLGETASVKLEDFTLSGKRGEAIRHGVNRARRGGARFEMLQQPLEPPQIERLRSVSDAWLAERNVAEKGFSLGNFNESYLARSPIGAIFVDDTLAAFASLMPDYGRHSELGVDLMRHIPQAPPGTMDMLFAELMSHAQAQGYRYFNLGMAPLVGVGETRYARTGEKVARLAYEYGNRFYNYKGVRSFKEKFHPEWRSVYLAYPVFTPLPMLLIDSAALIAGGYRQIFFKSV